MPVSRVKGKYWSSDQFTWAKMRGYGLVAGPDPFLLLRRRRDSAAGNEAGLDDGGQLYYDADGSGTDTTNP